MNNNIFQKARIKLTIYYIAIMAIILVAFSSVLTFTIESKIRQGFRDKIVITESEDDPIKNTSDDIEMLIYFVDGILLLVIGFSSYFLAGKTLKPIRMTLDLQKKFSSDASHDLRTPLAIMISEAEVALQNKSTSTSELRNTIVSNLEETKKMSKLVNDLLLISRGDNQANISSCEEINVHSFIENIIKKVRTQAQKKGLEIKLCEYKKIFIKVNKDNFERAISNIIQNAIKYTDTGKITVSIKEESQKISIIISDTGVGIDKKDLPYVFERFYRAEHSRNDSTSSGLGLSIAKQIIENHGGSITIKSEIGKGTEIIIRVQKSYNK